MRAFDRVIIKHLMRVPAKDDAPADEIVEYVGKIGMMGDAPMDDKSDELTEDGGPGSGNFGHKGRPGEVGGSGKGGAEVAGIGDGHGNLKEGTFTSDYKNQHVSEEYRQKFKEWAKQRENGFYYTGKGAKALSQAGMQIRDEILERVKFRKKAKDLPEWNKEGKVQIEDIYDVLRDIRSFGPVTEEAKSKILPVVSELPKERTDAIVKEALECIPTDWLEQAEFPVEIRIINNYGRAGYFGGKIAIFAKENPSLVKDLDLPTDEKPDLGMVNDLRHELGHYIEDSNYGIGSMSRDYLEQRTKDSPTEYNSNGEEIKRDKFFTSYMGRQYNYGATEILSCCLQALGYANPSEYMKNGFLGEHDVESYKFILGVLAFKQGGYF